MCGRYSAGRHPKHLAGPLGLEPRPGCFKGSDPALDDRPMVPPVSLELTTDGVSSRYSTKLSYSGV